MKITEIAVYQVDLPYRGGTYRLSGGRTYRCFDATLVCLRTDNGLEGWGESTPFGSTYIASHALGVRAGIAEMAPALLGRDPRQLDRINEVMDQRLVGHLDAKTAIDVACWDLFGKSVELPVCELLGGSTAKAMPTIDSTYAGDPEDMRRRVAETRAQGYIGHSIKVGASAEEGGPALDAARIEAALADARPGEFFIVDCNGGLTVEHGLRMLNLLPPGLDFVLEAPCATWRETLSLRRRTAVPIIFDELATDDVSVMQLICDDAAEGIGLKISKNGGLTRGRRQRDMCLSAGLTLSIQETVGSHVAFAALAHLGQTVPPRALRCILDTRDMVTPVTATFDAPLINGGVRVPDKPGLGIEIQHAVIGEPVAVYR
ncbi:MAG: mandelate racemase/muconate lactonizing enzyme family protein [Thiothrix sp.]|nr:mandelate racemase/muconate lactonizing enzyme family protein [Thiothrix sp.]HPE60217.1 mandelate racemase/muconate lactonizing enzyme family protein [Thiolinea sp.]